ncbi:MAG: phosphatidylserine/phosphatidylglycerophosphate/cardiolipin synthase family protein [Verrucomicrobiota bacterium]|nr:phosphatidylserine/phosphatidylglycerophosphate/cardiolipin synthase family protein [Verrucomicrobiota bacterium]
MWWRKLCSSVAFCSRHLFLFSLLLFCGWLVWKTLTPSLPKPEAPPQFYSSQCGQDLTLTFLEALRGAKDSIDLTIFGLTDPSILNELDRKGKEGVKTNIFYDFNGSTDLRLALPHCTLHPVVAQGLMHQKILIIDDKEVFLGSANMTPHSLQMHDNLVIGFISPQIASFLKNRTAARGAGSLCTFVGGQELQLWLLPDAKREALEELRNRLRSSKKSICAALFTFTHPVLLKELLSAYARGIEVTLVIDMHSGVGASSKCVEVLRKAGICVLFSQGVQLLHHKFVIIDETTLITGSANWTQAAFAKNSDTLLVFPKLTEKQKEYMQSLWRRLRLLSKEPLLPLAPREAYTREKAL